MKFYRKIADYFFHSFFPVRCPYCGGLITPNRIACEQCQPKTEPVNVVNEVDNVRCVSPFLYEGIYKRAVLDLKFQKCPDYARSLSRYMCCALENHFNILDFDRITCVPPSKKSYHERGYNQSELLAKEISACTGLKFRKLIVKIKKTKIQHDIDNAKERKLNVSNAFAVVNRYADEIKDKRILLVDDIMTTGATLNECCKVLYDSGAKSVICTTYVFVENKDMKGDKDYECL